MKHTGTRKMKQDGVKTVTITVTVNEKPVKFKDHAVTGMKIKETAISQGLKIHDDLVLFKVNPNCCLRQIRDNETITLHEAARFCAVTPDH
jgi:Multiubiquitin